MRYELCQHSDGSFGVKIKGGGEAMHSGMEPSKQADILYVQQTKLRTIFAKESCVWDVGMGAGVNALAIMCEALKASVPVLLVSFEYDLDALRLVLEHRDKFPHLKELRYEDFIQQRYLHIENVTWKLELGNFIETHMSCPSPHVIMWDPFSLKTEKEMWNFHLLNSVTSKTSERGAIFSTYSSSTRLRASLVALGWTVGYGAPLSHRSESTVAGIGPFSSLIDNPLGEKFKNKFLSSHARLPGDIEGNNEIEKSVLEKL